MDRARVRRVLAMPLEKLDDLGDQLSLYGRAIAWIPRTLRRYRKEVARLLAEVTFGSGALVVVLGTAGVMAGLSLFVGSVVGLQGFRALDSVGTQALTGTAYVVAQDSSPFGAGWTFSPVDQLVSIAADSYGPAGMLRVYGTGEYSFYTGTVTFSSPADDAGALSLTGGTYTYTSPDGTTETFNSGGYETQWASADGQETLQFRYNGSNQLTGVTATVRAPSFVGFELTVNSILPPGAVV